MIAGKHQITELVIPRATDDSEAVGILDGSQEFNVASEWPI